MPDIFGLNEGPFGRSININSSGSLLVTGDPAGGTYPYSTGDTGRCLYVDASGYLIVSLEGGAGEANTASNLGAGSQVYKAKSGVDLQFRSLTAGSGIGLVQSANSIEINTPMLIAKPFKTISAASGATTVDLAQYNNYYIPLSNSITITFANSVDGAKYLFVFKQTVGSQTVTFNNTTWVGGTTYSATAASGSVDFVAMVYCDPLSQYIGQAGLNIS